MLLNERRLSPRTLSLYRTQRHFFNDLHYRNDGERQGDRRSSSCATRVHARDALTIGIVHVVNAAPRMVEKRQLIATIRARHSLHALPKRMPIYEYQCQ